MDIFITQNSHYFVHRHFINIFLKDNTHIIYVKEKKRGKFKKIYEFIVNFGLFNSTFSLVMELIYFAMLLRKINKINFSITTDENLNLFLDEKLKNGNFNRVISIGCPCLIDTNFQKKYRINIYNLHGGIIPFQVGRFSPVKSLKKGHSYLGATLHLISKNFDDGLIVSQDCFRPKNRNIISNYNEVLKISASLLSSFLDGVFKKLPDDALVNLKINTL